MLHMFLATMFLAAWVQEPEAPAPAETVPEAPSDPTSPAGGEETEAPPAEPQTETLPAETQEETQEETVTDTEPADANEGEEGVEFASVADRVSADAWAYLETKSWDEIGKLTAETSLRALADEPELRAFLSPIWSGIKEDLTWLTREYPALSGLVNDPQAGKMTMAFLSVSLDESEDFDDDDVRLLVAVELPGRGEKIFADLKSLAESEGGDNTELIEVGGRPAIRGKEDVTTVMQDGDTIVFTVGEGVSEEFFQAPAKPLSQSESFQAVQAGLAVESPLMFAYVNTAAIFEKWPAEEFAEMFGVSPTFVETEDAQKDEAATKKFLRDVAKDSSFVEYLRGVGYGVGVDGKEMRDRLFMYAPGERPRWASGGQVGDATARHAGLATPKADLFATVWMDMKQARAIQQKEHERLSALAKAAGFEPDDVVEEDVMAEFVKLVKEYSGLDIEKDLMPALGNTFSIYVDIPVGGLVIPDAGLVLDLKDPQAVDALVTRMMEKDDEMAELDLQKMSYKEHELIAVSLINAGLPIMPTLCRVDNHLLVSLTPQAMKTTLNNIGKEQTFAQAESFTALQKSLGQNAGSFLWLDMQAAFRYLYSFVGVAMTAIRMQDEGMAERFDPSLLPAGDTIARHLGQGIVLIHEDEQGLYYDGCSTLANPVAGMMTGALGVVGLIGASEEIRSEVAEERIDVSREQMKTLSLAANTYRSSVGSGAWPENLVNLVDRGILSDVDVLVDPADPKPKRVRSGTGERIRLSYSIGATNSLSPEVRERLETDAEHFLYTRGTWHERFGQKGRLVLPLSEDTNWAIFVEEGEWGQ